MKNLIFFTYKTDKGRWITHIELIIPKLNYACCCEDSQIPQESGYFTD